MIRSTKVDELPVSRKLRTPKQPIYTISKIAKFCESITFGGRIFSGIPVC